MSEFDKEAWIAERKSRLTLYIDAQDQTSFQEMWDRESRGEIKIDSIDPISTRYNKPITQSIRFIYRELPEPHTTHDN